MSTIEVKDPVWQAIMADERLARARRNLSFHELRLIINHARSAFDEQLREAGFIRTGQGIGCAVSDSRLLGIVGHSTAGPVYETPREGEAVFVASDGSIHAAR